uniref:AP180 N-terminal homology (ANTH) domain-containing protein n=1 Tax=Eptatretus burgeri TaxID=7764 RepID=A0A8C4RCJ2_EPTBU
MPHDFGSDGKFIAFYTLEFCPSVSRVAFEEKHVHICILGTHREQGANTFWNVTGTFSFSSNSVLSWKFCNLLHKLLLTRLKELSRMWNHCHDSCGWLVATCIMLIMEKVNFHIGRLVFPPGLVVTDGELGAAGESGIGIVFRLAVELFAYMDSELSPFEAGFTSLDLSHAVFMTQAGQCRLAPLTQVIPNLSLLVSRPMEGQLRCHGEQGLDMRAFALAEHASPIVVIPGEEEPDLEAEPEPQPLLIPEPSITEGPNEKDLLMKSLCQEIRGLFTELQSFKSETQKVVKSLRKRVRELKAELDSDCSYWEYVQADALALQAESMGCAGSKPNKHSKGSLELRRKCNQ